MTARDRALVFECQGDTLIGVLSEAAVLNSRGRAVLLVVGGPQYRVGSHRQFLLLARRLAASGYPTLRFDYRGMGDSEGRPRTFESIGEDLASASSALRAACPGINEIVVWGLCDAASAALMFATAGGAFSGLVLLNPWVRTDATLAKTHLNHYYGERLLQREFWARLLRGELNVAKALLSLVRSVRLARAVRATADLPTEQTFIDSMRTGLERFAGYVLLVLSENDLTANEFDDLSKHDHRWSSALARPTITCVRVARADHTFSTAAWRHEVEQSTLRWLDSW